jgi:hypothetical protein
MWLSVVRARLCRKLTIKTVQGVASGFRHPPGSVMDMQHMRD